MDDKYTSAAPTIRDGGRPASLLGRAWLPAVDGPSVVTVRDGIVIDITSAKAPALKPLSMMCLVSIALVVSPIA